MQLPLYQINACTRDVYGGNPAGVCPLPKWLDDAALQAIATCPRRLNFDHPGMRTKSWTVYEGINSRSCRYSLGLRRPKDSLMRLSLYQRMYVSI